MTARVLAEEEPRMNTPGGLDMPAAEPPSSSANTRDLDEYRRDRIRKLEQRVDGLTRYRAHQEQVLALAVLMLSRLTGCTPEALLHALDALNTAADQ